MGRGRVRVLGLVRRSARCDLGLVDDLLRLRLAARRRDLDVALTAVEPPLRQLLVFVGVARLLLGEAQAPAPSGETTDSSTIRGGSPKSAKRSG